MKSSNSLKFMDKTLPFHCAKMSVFCPVYLTWIWIVMARVLCLSNHHCLTSQPFLLWELFLSQSPQLPAAQVTSVLKCELGLLKKFSRNLCFVADLVAWRQSSHKRWAFPWLHCPLWYLVIHSKVSKREAGYWRLLRNALISDSVVLFLWFYSPFQNCTSRS